MKWVGVSEDGTQRACLDPELEYNKDHKGPGCYNECPINGLDIGSLPAFNPK